ncbi:MAG: hypothetical protein ONB46_23415 [candidate division KSB1 bacterium]|nr:hypothetical protein [candidate division KSB1 bacterium]MDZ7368817.1 hypothetical protein [candidate division KSB1 bacterium]MDZ7406661.1 hypothetical protein [candidate division KSB1 bacterium]
MKTKLQKLDVKAALEYIEKAKKAGHSLDEAFSDYLATRGFLRSEEYEEFMQKFRKENRELTERIMANLEEIRRIAKAAQKKYAGV